MTGDLPRPNRAFVPNAPFRGPQYLNPTDKLVRVAVRSTSHGPCDWNTRRLPLGLGSTEVGRFDPVPGDDFDFLYAAQSSTNEAVAVQETLRGKVRFEDSTGQHIVARSELAARDLVTFEVQEHLTLIDIRRQEGRNRFGAPEEVQNSPDRDVTRDWGAYFREHSPENFSGLAYNSTVETSRLGSCSFILWADRLAAKPFRQTGSLNLASADGQRLVTEAFAGFDLLIA